MHTSLDLVARFRPAAGARRSVDPDPATKVGARTPATRKRKYDNETATKRRESEIVLFSPTGRVCPLRSRITTSAFRRAFHFTWRSA